MTGKFLGCITEAVGKGLDAETAAEARATYEEAFSAASEALGPAEADRAAGQAVMDALAAQALRQKQLTALSVRSRRAVLESAAAFKRDRGYSGVQALGGKGAKPPKGGWTQGGQPPKDGPWAKGGAMADWLKELVDGSGGLAGAAGPSIKGRYQALAGSFQAMMADLMDQFETVSGLPIRGKALLDNVVREAFGEESGDQAAKALAHAWEGASDFARRTFNAAGGGIGKLERWGLPQSHDPLSVRAAGRDGWVEIVAPMLDRGRMIDRMTGQPFSEKRLKAALGEVWDSIVSRGADDLEAGEFLGRGMKANQRAEQRFLVFKDADTWLGYARAFGQGDPYAAMMRHLDEMARDVALMQVLGPNPAHQFEWLARTAQIEAQAEQAQGALPRQFLKQAEGDIDSARKMLGMFTGELGTAYGADNAIAKVGAAVRAGLAGVQLGSAYINDLSSNGVWAAQTRTFAGMTRTGDFKAWMGHVLTAQTRQQARRAGFVLESARVRHAAAVRDFVRQQTVGGKIAAGANAFARFLPTWVHRAGFLQGNFAASRWSFQHEFMGLVADRAGKSLGELDGSQDEAERAFAAILKARGISPADWDKIRAVAPEAPEQGGGFVSPEAVRKATGDDELGWRYAEVIERETRAAVPEPSLWAQAQMLSSTRPGTVQGEVVRSLAAYRSFTVTQTYQWTREFQQRALAGAEDAKLPWQARAAAMAAPMMITLTLTGLLGLWAKDIAKGNDPRPLWDEDDPAEGRKRALRVAAQALAQGGGQGILGDFFASVEARNGKSSAMTALGAPAGFVSDTWNLTGGNLNEALSGQDTKLGREAVQYGRRYNPLASLWWGRTAFDRAVMDQVQKLVDPEAETQFRRQTRRLQREQGQEQWWPEGAVLPERAPSFAGVLGGDNPP